jgi:hypothetical protein
MYLKVVSVCVCVCVINIIQPCSPCNRNEFLPCTIEHNRSVYVEPGLANRFNIQILCCIPHRRRCIPTLVVQV